ncbi:MAG: cation transporter [bacterium]|nr:cation transporter [bacterium]
MNSRQKEIIAVSWLSIIGNGILSVLKIALGLVSGSLAVVGDGIDSASDIVTSVITLLTARIIARPPDIKYPYGYVRADTIAAKALSFVIFFAGAQLGISTIMQIIENKARELPTSLAIYITVLSIIGKLLLSWRLSRAGKKTGSSMLMANAKNMQSDVILSIAVLAGLLFTFLLRMPLLDTISALFVSIWIMKAGLEIFMQTTLELMDGIKNPDIYTEVLDIIESVDGVENPHRVRIRRFGNMYLMDIDIELEGSITITEGHNISHRVEERIKKEIKDVYDIVIHIEPDGVVDHNEKFGISRKDIPKE